MSAGCCCSGRAGGRIEEREGSGERVGVTSSFSIPLTHSTFSPKTRRRLTSFSSSDSQWGLQGRSDVAYFALPRNIGSNDEVIDEF